MNHRVVIHNSIGDIRTLIETGGGIVLLIGYKTQSAVLPTIKRNNRRREGQ